MQATIALPRTVIPCSCSTQNRYQKRTLKRVSELSASEASANSPTPINSRLNVQLRKMKCINQLIQTLFEAHQNLQHIVGHIYYTSSHQPCYLYISYVQITGFNVYVMVYLKFVTHTNTKVVKAAINLVLVYVIYSNNKVQRTRFNISIQITRLLVKSYLFK